MSIQVFIMAAVLVEALTGLVKSLLSAMGFKLPDWVDQTISLLLAMAFAFLGRIDFFALVSQVTQVDLHLPAALGMLVAGLVMSRGSNGVHDLFKKLNPRPAEKRIW